MTNVGNNFNLNANTVFKTLDSKDGTSNRQINANEWNAFAELVGGKPIKYAIKEENALKSINYYLNQLSDEAKKSVADYLGVDIKNNKPIEQEIIQQASKHTAQKTNFANKTSVDIFDELDIKDGSKDNTIQAKEWNDFAKQVGGKTISFSITKENALKSINSYLNKQSEIVLKTQEKEKTTATSKPIEKKDVEIQKQKTSFNNQNNFEKDTLDLNNRKFQHTSRLLEVAQDSLGIYEITAKEYEILKRENPDELKNTQAYIVGDYGMKHNHQWCAYTVGHLAQKAGMNMSKLSSVQGYINAYKNDYDKIPTQKMNKVNYQEERQARAKAIEKQLPKMNEGDFIIWKGDYVVPDTNGAFKNSNASHIGIIEQVDLANGIVTVIEGNANISEMNENQERIPVKTKADCKRGAQTFGEYKDVNNRDGLIRKQYTIEELSKHGYTGFINNQSRIK